MSAINVTESTVTRPAKTTEEVYPDMDGLTKFEVRCQSAAKAIAKTSNWDSATVANANRLILTHAKRCRRLRRLHQQGSFKRAKKFEAHLIKGFAGRMCAEIYEHAFSKASKQSNAPVSWEKLERRANRSMLTGHRADPAKVYVIQKSNGTQRLVVDPGARTRSSQRALSAILDARGCSNSRDYNQNGQGRDGAVREIVRLATEEGIESFVVFDLANFFPSVRHTHLLWLDMPSEVMKRVVFFTSDAPLIRKGPSTELTKMESARQGLPPGAVASGKIASALLGREIRSLDGVQGGVLYVDDGALGARSPAEADKVAKALHGRLAKHPGGPISFKTLEIRNIRDGFCFLGYWIKLREEDGKERVAVSPSHQAKQKLRRLIFKMLRSKGPELDFEVAVTMAHERLGRWLPGYKLWTYSPMELQDLKDEVLSWVDDFFNGFERKLPTPKTKP